MIGVSRHTPAPKSLGSQTTYKAQDVRDQLQEDFHGKCYLCERYVGPEFQVEHLRPKETYPHLKFEWNNLFPACTCNQRRLKWSGRSEIDVNGNPTGFPQGGMLDAAADDIEVRLRQRPHIGVSVTEFRIEFEAQDGADLAACNTAEELFAIHNKGETGHVRRLKDEIRNHLSYIWRKMSEYFEAASNGEGDRTRDLEGEIRPWTLPSAPFAGIVRSMFRNTYRPDTLARFGL